MSVYVTQLAPHSCLSSDYVDLGKSSTELVKISPVYVSSVRSAITIAKADVKVGLVIV